MSDTIVRKCGACPDPIEIKRNDIENIIFYKKTYYHSKCFCNIAEKRSKKKIKTAQEWKDALDNIIEIEQDTKSMLENAWVGDDLAEWLLNHYDIAKVPDRIWSILADLKNGKYKNKRCKPVTTETILETWKWGQRKLDSISKNNKMNHKGPADDDARIMYDLSIIISKVPNYLAYKEKQRAAEFERKRELKENIKIDYNKITSGTKKNNSSMQDISSLVDDIF